MSTPLVLTVPATDAALREEITQQLALHAHVQEQTQSFGLDVQFFVEVLSATASATTIISFLLAMRDRYTARGQSSGVTVGRPSQPGTPLEQADAALLRKLLDV